ncbi:Glutathione S-transferase [Bradyrhizobium sp. ORS 375]|nr:Glutathione S-transferase [Bradyrhizobium sp. ORS 375]
MTGQADYTVFGHHDSGHSYKVCLFLELAGLRYRYMTVDVFSDPESRPAEFRRLSRFGEVPVLVHGDLCISQSNAILSYLAEQTALFGGTDRRSRAAVNEWLFWEMSRLNLGVANLRFALRFETNPPSAVVSLYRRRATDALRQLDAHLERAKFIVGSSPTIADISCAGYLFWADQAKLDLSDYGNVARWLGDVRRLDRWRPPEAILTPAPAEVGA